MGSAGLPLFDPLQPPSRRGRRRSASNIKGKTKGGSSARTDVKPKPVAQAASPPPLKQEAPPTLTVSALIARVKCALADAFPRRVAVVGEISNFKLHSSGHMYFRLKDADAAIDAAMFRQFASRVRFTPADGLEVVAEGRVDVYDPRGQLQFYVESMTPRGAGALELAFRQLREKLQREGLFDPAVKKPLARFPRAVGVITSPTGAAVRDICRTLQRRWPAARVYLMPVLVQGEGAAESVAEGIAMLDTHAGRFGIDTIIVARGGGSLEDLWAFNEEIVARAIFAAVTPIVTGVGHETDVTIADLAADVRAATPTAAAELAVPDATEVLRHLASLHARLHRSVAEGLASAAADLRGMLRSAIFRDPAVGLRIRHQRLDELSHRLRADLGQILSQARRRLDPAGGKLAALAPARLAEVARGRLDRLAARLAWALGARSKRAGDVLAVWRGRLLAVHPAQRLAMVSQRLNAAGRQLEAMSYRGVLRRGFSVTRKADGAILRSRGDVTEDDWITTELADGIIHSRLSSPPGGDKSDHK